MYPVVTMGEGCHKGSRDNLLGPDPSPEKIVAYSCEKNIPADAPHPAKERSNAAD